MKFLEFVGVVSAVIALLSFAVVIYLTASGCETLRECGW